MGPQDPHGGRKELSFNLSVCTLAHTCVTHRGQVPSNGVAINIFSYDMLTYEFLLEFLGKRLGAPSLLRCYCSSHVVQAAEIKGLISLDICQHLVFPTWVKETSFIFEILQSHVAS